MKVGIDSIQYYIPKTYLPIKELAEARGIEYAKLNKGLGLEAMAIPDVDEDIATMAANAVLRLFADKQLYPKEVGRIYLGTESALDAAKATASYVAEIVEQQLQPTYGERCLKNCDVVDLTFACIGGIDALENAMDWVRADETRKAIVVAADMAKYDLESTGEYTQGAGAVAVLVTANPGIIAFNANIGVAMGSVSDFFKPRRSFNKSELLQKAAELLGTNLSEDDALQLLATAGHGFWNDASVEVEIHKDEPVFDGPYSNDCYQERITEALQNFQSKQHMQVLDTWQKLVFHLPYAFQGRRMITGNWIEWMHAVGRGAELDALINEMGLADADENSKVKALSKSTLYKQFVNDYIAQGERASSLIGNMYTGSIFMSLLSLLINARNESEELEGNKIGFFAYGSGSKAKVLEGEVQAMWKNNLEQVSLFEDLNDRTAISFENYENWHKGKLKRPLVADRDIKLTDIGKEGVTQGYRYYA